MIEEIQKEEGMKLLFSIVFSIILLTAAVVLVGLGINWYAGVGVGAALLYINSTR